MENFYINSVTKQFFEILQGNMKEEDRENLLEEYFTLLKDIQMTSSKAMIYFVNFSSFLREQFLIDLLAVSLVLGHNIEFADETNKKIYQKYMNVEKHSKKCIVDFKEKEISGLSFESVVNFKDAYENLEKHIF